MDFEKLDLYERRIGSKKKKKKKNGRKDVCKQFSVKFIQPLMSLQMTITEDIILIRENYVK